MFVMDAAQNESRFVPRDFTSEPTGFGKVRNIQWVPQTDDRGSTLLAAARLQHLYCYRIRLRLAESHYNKPRVYADALGMSYDRLMKVLRGQYVLTLVDIATADILLGPVSELAHNAMMREDQEQQKRQTGSAVANSRATMIQPR